MAVFSLFNYSRIQAMGFPVFRLILNNWGNRGATADPNSLEYGGAISADQMMGSAFAVAIGPDSTVDRATIAFDPFFQAAFIIGPPEAINANRMQVVSSVRPSGQLAGPLNVRAHAINFYSDSYLPDLQTVTQPFGGAVAAPAVFESPVLELDVYLKALPGQLYGKRNPMFRPFGAFNMLNIISPFGVEQLVAIWPVMGRKGYTVHGRFTGDIVGSMRVGIISYAAPGLVVTIVPTENTVGTATLNATTGVQGLISGTWIGQYLAVYATASAGTGGFFEGAMLADDDGTCCGVLNQLPPPP